ncbi:MAG TPA: flagellar motor stator protein MotA [Vicinamibacterales bacterium]|nr:flagellar motor stator protein MotA [Vicinamibacterales bacterium]
MLVIVGMLVVVLSVAGGYLWEGGHLMLLNQPAEFVIIGGAAAGTLIVGTPMAVLKEMVTQLKHMMGGGPTRQDFTDLVVMLYQLFRVVQATGVMALESHFDNPQQSPILSKYPRFLARKSSVSFLADSARVIIVGGISPHDFDHLMYEDLEVRHKNSLLPANTLTKVGDALPGLGIVAAVLGVVITMQAIDGPVTEIGHKVGAALVGTFLGILLSYGFVQPLAASMEHRVNEELNIEQCIKAGLLAMYKGFPPAIAVEFARRVVPDDLRPSFEETEALCRGARSEVQVAA